MSTGEYCAILEQGDILYPTALYTLAKEIYWEDADFIYTDECYFHDKAREPYCYLYKPSYAPDNLRSGNYIANLTVFNKNLLGKTGGGFRAEFGGVKDYDLILRLTEKATVIKHVPEALYYRRCQPTSLDGEAPADARAAEAGKEAVAQHLKRLGLKGEVLDARIPAMYRIAYEIDGSPLISILIPNKDHVDDLKKCVDSIIQKSTYSNWEIIVIENNSTDESTFNYYEQLSKNPKVRVVTWPDGFNYSAINNYGARFAGGEYILLLNNDTEVISPDWLEQMLMYAQRSDVGIVGAMLYYPDNTIQHAGVVFEQDGTPCHYQRGLCRGENGYMNSLCVTQNYSAVTGACVMMRRDVWDEIEGLDESFAVTFNDIDICMRIRRAGYITVWTPFAELFHSECKTRGLDTSPEKAERFQREFGLFKAKWSKELSGGDPYYIIITGNQIRRKASAHKHNEGR